MAPKEDPIMCRTPTPTDQQVACSRCGEVANPTDGWEHGWPNYGRVEVGLADRAVAYLSGSEAIASVKGHPALVESGPQNVVLEWGDGIEFDSRERGCRLCRECQIEFFGVLGEFFGMRAVADEAAA